MFYRRSFRYVGNITQPSCWSSEPSPPDVNCRHHRGMVPTLIHAWTMVHTWLHQGHNRRYVPPYERLHVRRDDTMNYSSFGAVCARFWLDGSHTGSAGVPTLMTRSVPVPGTPTCSTLASRNVSYSIYDGPVAFSPRHSVTCPVLAQVFPACLSPMSQGVSGTRNASAAHVLGPRSCT